MMQATPKYRPYLTITDIRHILSLAKADSPLSDRSKTLIKTLSPYLTKIENDVMIPAHITLKKDSMLEALGEVDPDKPITLSVQELRFNAYHKWNTQGADSCSIEELELAYEYRVHHNMLTDEELARESDSWNDVDMSKYTSVTEGES